MKIPREEFLAQAKQREEYCDRLFEKYRDERCNDSLTEFLEIQKPLMYHFFVKVRSRNPEDFEKAWDDGVILLFRCAERFDSSKGHACAFFWYQLRDAFSRIYKKRNTLTRRRAEGRQICLVNFTDLTAGLDDFLFESTIQDREDGAKYAESGRCMQIEKKRDGEKATQRHGCRYATRSSRRARERKLDITNQHR